MSTGGSIPYHLRTNKAIERQIFIDTLKKIHTFQSIFDYVYVGFGGPFLEDFKLLHNMFDFRQMISLEIDENVVKRQRFNQPYSCITCKHEDSKSFISEYRSNIGNNNTIVWLDYTRPKELRQQLNEVSDLIAKMKAFDILRVTFNANPSSLVENNNGMHPDKLKLERLEKLKERIEHFFLESQIDAEMMTHKGFPSALNTITKNAIDNSIQAGYIFLPLTAFTYSDGQQMYTLTGIILQKEDYENFLETTQFAEGWEFYNHNWQPPIKIDVPSLSVQEKSTIDMHLPFFENYGESLNKIEERLGFLFDTKNEMLESYIKFYRQFPQFSKITI